MTIPIQFFALNKPSDHMPLTSTPSDDALPEPREASALIHEQRAMLDGFRSLLLEQKALVDRQQEREQKVNTDVHEMELACSCPISGQIFDDPVFLIGTGRIFEREAVESLLATAKKDHQKLLNPLTRAEISGEYEPCYFMKSLVDSFLTAHPEKKEKQYQKGSQAHSAQAKTDAADVTSLLPQFFRTSAESSLIRLPVLVALLSNPALTVVDNKIHSKVVLDGEGAREYFAELFKKQVANQTSRKENVLIFNGEGVTFELHIANELTSVHSLYQDADFILCCERTPDALQAWMRDITELKRSPSFRKIDLDERSDVLLHRPSSLEGKGVSWRMFPLVTSRLLYKAHRASHYDQSISSLLEQYEKKREARVEQQRVGGGTFASTRRSLLLS